MEDDARFGKYLVRACDPFGDVGWVQTATDARAQLLSPALIDVLILDIRLGPEDGLDVLEEARPLRPALPVLAITGFDDVESVNRACSLHCLFLRKTARGRHMLETVADFVRRETRVPRAVRRQTKEHIDRHLLTAQQGRILRAYMEGVPRHALADKFGIAESTLCCHINAILAGRFTSLASLAEHILTRIEQDDSTAPLDRSGTPRRWGPSTS